MGHVDKPVGNKWIVEPWRKGSVFNWSNVMDFCVEESVMVDQQRLGITVVHLRGRSHKRLQ